MIAWFHFNWIDWALLCGILLNLLFAIIIKRRASRLDQRKWRPRRR